MKLVAEPLAGLKLIELPRFDDARGTFVKSFHAERFADLGIAFAPREEFFSVSHRGVLRGMHFQAPPADHAKLVFCPTGRVLDVALDLRTTSGSFRRYFYTELSEQNHYALFLPHGFAHGYLVLEGPALVCYSVSSVHVPSLDRGIRWNSFEMDWPEAAPVLSERDRNFPSLLDFRSPF